MKRYVLERTNMAEKRPEEQSEKVESCRKNLWQNIIFLFNITKEWESSVALCQEHKPQHPHHVKVSLWDNCHNEMTTLHVTGVVFELTYKSVFRTQLTEPSEIVSVWYLRYVDLIPIVSNQILVSQLSSAHSHLRTRSCKKMICQTEHTCHCSC